MKPVLVVSKCLGFARCRYNGEMLSDPLIERLKDFAELRPVCPEMEMGLGVPRDPIRIIQEQSRLRLYQPATGRDVTAAMHDFTDRYFASLGEIDGFILKSRSPSCGPAAVKIYKGSGTGTATLTGPGLFALQAFDHRPGIPVEDEGRLTNFTIREHFLTWIFTRASLRQAAAAGRIRDLVSFQARHKYLFMAVNQAQMRQLGRISARSTVRDKDRVFEAYRQGLDRLFKQVPTPGSWINIIQHAFGYVSDRLTAAERQFFSNSIEEYRDERIPLSALVKLVHSWAVRFEETYLLAQSFLDPFPEPLRDLADSGRNRKGIRSSRDDR